ncbi:hypothetical protein [Pseudorhodobacter sp.]|uniref:DUF6963 family protein n=1 Tax=Pseudorhodobacter sp. TaxID=1934400 RepID=UPI002647893C|nr:hypothetical protein [Pseudorhodobacter sp.]MDN5787856.1 hypothetical protein [Pseudorhodobacter sp.]
MTIGIAAYGPGAGAAVLAAWAKAEEAGTGSIHGFAVFTVIPCGCGPISVECQRGGLQTIRQEWQESGLWQVLESAPVAAVITSGPDRALPLTQFLVAAREGLVTGHRMPNLPGQGGLPVNTATLRLIAQDVDPQVAVARVTAANPDLDSGLIAVTPRAIGLAETAHVQARTDRGQALKTGVDRGIALLHNSIDPVQGYAAWVADAGFAAFR